MNILNKKIELIINSEKGKDIIRVKSGGNLFNVLIDKGIFIDSPCNGKGICGKCKVKVIKGLKKPTPLDIKQLAKEELESGFRLSCNFTINEDTEIVLLEKNKDMKVLINGTEQQYTLDTVVKKKYLVIEKPSINDQRDDYRRLSDACESDDLLIDLQYLPQISNLLRETDFNVTASLYKNRLLHLENGNCLQQNYGLAVDIGTTTIVIYLLNLNDGKVIDIDSRVNNQRSYGADVVSRINFTIENPKGLGILKDNIVSQLNDMIELLCKKNNISEDNIYDIVIVGNTIMIHLLLGLPCENITRSPYIPVVTKALELEAKEIGIKTKGMVSLLPGISAFVGSDITAGILSCGMLNSEKYSLLLDLGTNGEIALGNKNEVVTCSTAAGPAFEGTNIKHGIGAVKGAISKVDLSRDKIYETIGNEKPCGICGSGVLDAVAQFVKFGILDEAGRMAGADEVENKDYQNRIVEVDNMRQFILVQNSIHEESITFTQKDVREVQLAKAAVCAGIKILLKEKNINFNEIEKVYIGGGFGNYMDIESSVDIGMIPKELKGKIESVGNCAGGGAKTYLLSKQIRENAADIINKTTYIELSKRKDFQEYFIDSMILD
ncbi:MULTISPECIES: ASKHA domain-containing protein [Clostridium]|uniref:Na(+)-translocating NADH-quinone reductase subunit F n=1 Tax=Clostridium ragsdalei P11 TaxID=1353534 RepID=A0A1A6ALY8_9CLOT|nr:MULTISPECIES: ASKHA domain-containing protein [Clostridium]OBR91090.1 Na(+)-translocating NADH-quinone reductase subunit F [Clostridium ragsdalei P11]QXE20063.1 metal-binding protein [Clostridium sp. 001]